MTDQEERKYVSCQIPTKPSFIVQLCKLWYCFYRLGDYLGSGQFGTVYKGVWKSQTRGEVQVAVKTLNEGSTKNDKIKFLQEAAIMAQFKHPNVVEMYGVITEGEPVSV